MFLSSLKKLRGSVCAAENMRDIISNATWAVMKPPVVTANLHRGGPAPKSDDRTFIKATL